MNLLRGPLASIGNARNSAGKFAGHFWDSIGQFTTVEPSQARSLAGMNAVLNRRFPRRWRQMGTGKSLDYAKKTLPEPEIGNPNGTLGNLGTQVDIKIR